jgi:hypothetical protein
MMREVDDGWFVVGGLSGARCNETVDSKSSGLIIVCAIRLASRSIVVEGVSSSRNGGAGRDGSRKTLAEVRGSSHSLGETRGGCISFRL